MSGDDSPLTTVVYFDTCAWSHLYDGAVLMRPGWDTVATLSGLSNLRHAVSSGAISIVLSMVALEELIADPEDYQPRAALALKLSDWSRPVKPTIRLLTETIQSYAAGGRPASPVFRGRDQWQLVSELSSTILGTSPEDIAARKEATERAREQIAKFHEAMMRGQDATLLVLREHPELWRSWTFDNFWDEVSIRFTESTARRLGVLNECRSRGIEGLLEIPTVRMAIGVSASLMFAQVQRSAVQKPQPQDSRDLQHAVMAAARASIFVTDDAKLMRLVSRVPMTGFETVRLPEFLARLS